MAFFFLKVCCDTIAYPFVILFYDLLVMDTPTLTLPHPLLHQRLFVLSPLAEIAPTLKHPILQKTIRTLHHELLAKEQSPC